MIKNIIHLNSYNNLYEIDLANYIKWLFKNGTHYIIIKNINKVNNNNNNNDIFFREELLLTYEFLNNKIGIMREIDTNKYTDYVNSPSKKIYWVDVQYNTNIKSDKPWKSNKALKLHTDNTVSTKNNYAQITELICMEPCKYSGLTTIISNNFVVELIKYIDEITNDSLFMDIYNYDIHYSFDGIQNFKNKILIYDDNKSSYIFSFNYTQAIKSPLNSEKDLKIIEKLNYFLEEKMTNSHLMDEIKLEPFDALLFNDELVLHGRRSVISNRHYKKCSIFIP
jgi:hypothetical protein